MHSRFERPWVFRQERCTHNIILVIQIIRTNPRLRERVKNTHQVREKVNIDKMSKSGLDIQYNYDDKDTEVLLASYGQVCLLTLPVLQGRAAVKESDGSASRYGNRSETHDLVFPFARERKERWGGGRKRDEFVIHEISIPSPACSCTPCSPQPQLLLDLSPV